MCAFRSCRRDSLSPGVSEAESEEQIASETPGERAACLQHLRACQQERIAPETPGERAACLQLLRAHQQEWIASETPEETAARRQRDREAHSHRPPSASAQPLLHQPAVQASCTSQDEEVAITQESSVTCHSCSLHSTQGNEESACSGHG